jgi:hypothetical protein
VSGFPSTLRQWRSDTALIRAVLVGVGLVEQGDKFVKFFPVEYFACRIDYELHVPGMDEVQRRSATTQDGG